MGCAPSTATPGPLQEMLVLEHLKKKKQVKEKKEQKNSNLTKEKGYGINRSGYGGA
jgi:hypothetical protein